MNPGSASQPLDAGFRRHDEGLPLESLNLDTDLFFAAAQNVIPKGRLRRGAPVGEKGRPNSANHFPPFGNIGCKKYIAVPNKYCT